MERVAVDLGRSIGMCRTRRKRSAAYLNSIYNLGQEIKAQREGEQTNIIRISAMSNQPERAGAHGQFDGVAYRVENIAARNRLVTESRRFVEEQLENLEKRLNDSEEALRAFKER